MSQRNVLGNYLTIALRHLVSQKLYSAINIVGLAIGLACCIVIMLFVRHELSYDRHYAKADRIYRISRDFFDDDDGVRQLMAANAPVVAELLELDFPQIEEAARIYCCGTVLAEGPDASYFEEAPLADNELFELFDFEWLKGDPTAALLEPYTIVVTESAAQRYFGDEDPMGQTLMLDNQWPARVTGVIRDLPDNTHLVFELLISLPTAVAAFGEEFVQGWSGNNFHTYILLEEGADIAAIQEQSGAFFERHYESGSSAKTGFTAYALTDIHLRSNREFEIGIPGSLTTVIAFGAIAVLVLLVACINFMSLATARAGQRAKEVGMRKVVGAERSQVIVQFLSESILVVIISVILSLMFVELALPAFSTFVQKPLDVNYFSDATLLPMLAVLTLLVGFLAGSYPAFYLSAFEPARVLKGDISRGTAAAILRKLLVVLQSSISIVLVIATAVVYSQTQFARNIELGYNKDQIVVLSAAPTIGLGDHWESLKQQLLAHPEITHVTASRLTPGLQNADATDVRYEGGPPDSRGVPFMFVDFDFFETYEIEVLAGRTFSEDFGTDEMVPPTEDNPQPQAAYIVTELAARQFGWTPDEAIGKWLEIDLFDSRGEVVGVIADIYFESVRSALEPVVYMIPPNVIFGFPALRQASVRVSGHNLEGTLAYVDAKWNEFVPDQPVNRRFLDDDFQALYQDEQRQTQILTFFSLLAIFIACLGLFGLASFTSERRTKEIGIRKIVGGTVWDIVRLLTTEFSKLVLLANIVAWPAAYFLMSAWLERFAYRIDLGPIVFLSSSLLAFVIAWLTVGGVAARAANVSPASALRHE